MSTATTSTFGSVYEYNGSLADIYAGALLPTSLLNATGSGQDAAFHDNDGMLPRLSGVTEPCPERGIRRAPANVPLHNPYLVSSAAGNPARICVATDAQDMRDPLVRTTGV